MSFKTPKGNRYPTNAEERLFRLFLPKVVKIFRSQHFCEKNNMHYDGPQLTGSGAFHQLTIEGKVIALHAAFTQFVSKGVMYTYDDWKNSVFDCLYSWILYEIEQELISAESSSCRNHVFNAYKQVVHREAIQPAIANYQYWTDLVNKLASQTIWITPRMPEEKEHKVEIDFSSKEKFEEACDYFDNGMMVNKKNVLEDFDY